MPKRKHSLSDDEHQPDPQYSKKKDSQPSVSRQEHAEPNSDESHRTEQLLHRESVTPPQRRPLRKRRPKQKPSSKRINKKAAPPPLTCCRSQTNSEEESDILHYNPDTALYYPGTDLVIDGWFQPCRCQEKLTKAVEGVAPYDCDSAQEGCIDYFYGWMNIQVPLKRQQTAADRLLVQHDLIIRMSEHWVSCREEARAQNCRVPCA